MTASGRVNHETPANRQTTADLKHLVANIDGLDAKCRRILSVYRESWWGDPYTDRSDRAA